MENKHVFLATTALEEFWDTSSPLLFLGEWCLLYDRRPFWETLGGECLESPYDDDRSVGVAYRYLKEVYERTLPVLGDALNSIHGTNHGSHYWRIVLGPWMNYYLSATYDRYLHIRKALELYPDLRTVVLSEESFVTPATTLDFGQYIAEDSFNLQMCTKILAALGKSFPSQPLRIPQTSRYGLVHRRSWKHRVLNIFEKTYLRAGSVFVRPVVLKDSHFKTSVELAMMARLPFGIFRDRGRMAVPPDMPYDHQLRSRLPEVFTGQSEYEACLEQMFRSDIPVCFVEGFSGAVDEARKTYPKKAKAILSANAWYHNETFKYWAAEAAEEGTVLLGVQHGGNYGSLANMFSEDHETAIADRYYTWGWERAGCHAEVVPMPATKFAGRQKMPADNGKEGILWLTTSSPRYFLQFPVLPKDFSAYLSWQDRFAGVLKPGVRAVVSLRPHPQDYGWDIVRRLCEHFPDIRIEAQGVPFVESLENCRLYVCDHLSTTFLEALAAGKPTVLFWSPGANELKKDAQPYYERMRECKILFDTPEQAGEAVNCIYEDVESWWNEPERQALINEFCKHFARHSEDAVELWVQEMRRITAASPPSEKRTG